MSTTREFTAKHRFARITSRKAGLIANLIRGRSVNDAIETLQFTPNRGAAFYMKVLKSAVANASLDEDVNVNRLYISDARADVGPLLNDRMRFRPGPQGRAMPFAKRLSHLTIKVREVEIEDGTEGESEGGTATATKVKGARKKAAKSKKKLSSASKAATKAGTKKSKSAPKSEKASTSEKAPKAKKDKKA
jgi:large subunit ribosomal protein L22